MKTDSDEAPPLAVAGMVLPAAGPGTCQTFSSWGGHFLHKAGQWNPDVNSVVPLCKHQIKTFQTPLKVQ